MAQNMLTANFNYLFERLNPSSTFVQRASSEYKSIIAQIENPYGLARALSPMCFLQGSYRENTAIYSINDVDIVALCRLWQPGSGGTGSKSWSRDEIFDTIAAPLLGNQRYRDKVRYNSSSMCIKVDLGIKIEILPVVYKSGNNEPGIEPFRLFRQTTGKWEDGYARYHQRWLSWKNRSEKTNGNFIPAVKVFKHICSKFQLNAVSFHIECLLFSIPDQLFHGGPANYITNLLSYVAQTTADTWHQKVLNTPCRERDIFVPSEWDLARWKQFHQFAFIWADLANVANQANDVEVSIKAWQLLFGEEYFPRQVSP